MVGRKTEVSWGRAWPAIAATVEEVTPDGLLCLGVCPEPFFRLELMAKNLAAPAADVLGERPTTDGRMRIVPDGPPAYWTALPVEWLGEQMEQRRVNLASREAETHYAHTHLWPDAGFYLCNQVFYLVMHYLGDRVPHRGFVHVPRLAEPDADRRIPTREEVLTAGVYLVGELARWLARASAN